MSFRERIPEKIMPVEEVLQWTAHWRLQDKKIVFTNGVFDIIHQGHVDYLMKAADYGHRLIIGLNSDTSVKMLNKGDSRPFQDEKSRALILSSMAFVSAVCIFNEENPASLIEKINPDILIKGGDYAVEEIAGSDHVVKTGGKVLTIPLVEGFSTTLIENKIKQS